MAAYPRVQVLLRDGIFELINEIAKRDNLSVSKVCGMLIQESLAARNLWDIQKAERIQPSQTRDVLDTESHMMSMEGRYAQSDVDQFKSLLKKDPDTIPPDQASPATKWTLQQIDKKPPDDGVERVTVQVDDDQQLLLLAQQLKKLKELGIL